MNVTMQDMRAALDQFGIERDAILLTHSSLKAAGHIEGGAEAVIEAIEATVPDGTVVFPTLSQKNFETAFEDWSLDRPSDVGAITETFRLQSGSLRSDNPTHSVAARGRLARDLVKDHARGEGRYGVFGDLCFGAESPWQRMFDSRTRYGVRCYVLFWGVDTVYNTFKHFSEYRLAENLLNDVRDSDQRNELRLSLLHKPSIPHPRKEAQIWPFYTAKLLEPMLFEVGIARRVPLGESALILCDAYEMMSFAERILATEPHRIIENEAALAWIERAKMNGSASAHS